MIRCMSYITTEYQKGDQPAKVMASLQSDTKDEVLAMGGVANDIVGLANGVILELGSDCFTTNQELGLLTSDGVWKF